MPFIKGLIDKFLDALARKVAERITSDLRFTIADLQYETAHLTHLVKRIYEDQVSKQSSLKESK